MEHSEKIDELGIALAKAQSVIKAAKKNSNNPFFKSTYADLSANWDACREALSSNGLSIIQTPEESESGLTLSTMMLHSSGQWIKCQYNIPVSKADAQAFGSAISYARRYALAAIVGIATEDDDGNSAVESTNKTSKSTPKQPTAPTKKELLPAMKDVWERAKESYKDKKNLDVVKEHFTISELNEKRLISECQPANVDTSTGEIDETEQDVPQ